MANKRRRPSALPKGPILVTAGTALLFGCGPKAPAKPPQMPPQVNYESMPQPDAAPPPDAPVPGFEAPQPPPQESKVQPSQIDRDVALHAAPRESEPKLVEPFDQNE